MVRWNGVRVENVDQVKGSARQQAGFSLKFRIFQRFFLFLFILIVLLSVPWLESDFLLPFIFFNGQNRSTTVTFWFMLPSPCFLLATL